MKVTIFIKNTIVLIFTSLVLRTAGILFKIFIAEKIGSEGMGLYQLIFSLYIFAATFASSGLSTAVTRLVAEEMHKGKIAIKKIMSGAVTITLAIAFVSATIIYFGADIIADFLIKDSRATNSFKILSLSLPFMGLSSCVRGYFIACRKTIQPSVVQMLEQAIRMAVVLTLLSLTAHKSIEFCVTCVLLGDAVAETASFLINWILYLKDIKKQKGAETTNNTYKRIFKIAVPISSASYISTALHTAESLLIPFALAIFHGSRERGLELFGAIRGMALPVIFFPASFLTSLSTTLIPEVSEANATGNSALVKRTVEKSVFVTLMLSIFTAVCFCFNANEVGMLLYKDNDVGEIIRILSPIIPFMYLESVVAGLLKGLDCQTSLLKYNVIDSGFRIASVFVVLPKLGVKGYLLIMIVSNILTSMLNFSKLLKVSNVKLDFFAWILKPLFVSFCGGFLGFYLTKGIEINILRLIISVVIQAIFFILFEFIPKRKKQTFLSLKKV